MNRKIITNNKGKQISNFGSVFNFNPIRKGVGVSVNNTFFQAQALLSKEERKPNDLTSFFNMAEIWLPKVKFNFQNFGFGFTETETP